MTCTAIPGGILCHYRMFRLPLADGRRVFMIWHSYLGPEIYRDRNCYKPMYDWWEDQQIIDAVGWFEGRGYRA